MYGIKELKKSKDECCYHRSRKSRRKQVNRLKTLNNGKYFIQRIKNIKQVAQIENSQMADINPIILSIILNANILNILIKRDITMNSFF